MHGAILTHIKDIFLSQWKISINHIFMEAYEDDLANLGDSLNLKYIKIETTPFFIP